jgi:hypothetical protein
MDQQETGKGEPLADGPASGVSAISVSQRSKRLRWAAASVVVVLVLVATVAGAFVLSGAAGSRSLTAGVAPKDTVAFMEIRTDLPGDQRTRLADFMSHFPGFMDRAQFDFALDELLNKLTGEVSPDLRYSSAFKPWMEGEVSVAMTDLGAIGENGRLDYREPNVVAIFALKDRAAAETWIAGELSRIGVAVTSQAYAGAMLHLTGSGASVGAYALTERDLLLGTVDGVKAALDTKTKGSLADNATYRTAMKSVSGDSLARFYLDPASLIRRYVDSFNSMLESVFGSAASPAPTSGTPIRGMPEWLAGSIRAESDRMVVDVAMPQVAADGLGNHISRLAPVLPGTTVGVIEVHSVGRLISKQLESMDPIGLGALVSRLGPVKDAISRLGGIDWLGDGAAVVTRRGATFEGGLVVEAKDAATASAQVAGLSGLASFGGAAYGLSSRVETYKGVSMTIIGTSSAGAAPMEFAVAAKDNLIIAGYTSSFVRTMVDTTRDTSLAAASDYSAVISAVGASNEQSIYVNIPALEDQVGLAMLGSDRTSWSQNYKPYFDSLGGLGYSAIDGDTVILRLVVMAK